MTVILARGHHASASTLNWFGMVLKHFLLVLNVDLKGAKVVVRAYFSGCQRIFQ
jgi:hypothetical protein